MISPLTLKFTGYTAENSLGVFYNAQGPENSGLFYLCTDTLNRVTLK